MIKAKQLNIMRYLMLGFCALISIFILFSAFTLYDIHRVSNLSRTIYNHPLVVSNAALQADVYITKMHRSMKDVVLFDSSSRIKQSIEAVNEEEEQVYRHLNIVKKNILGEEGKALENEARKLFDEWRPIRNKVIRLVHNDQRENAAKITIGDGANHVALLEVKMLGLTNYALNKASEFTHKTERVYSRLKVTSIFFLLLGIFISILVAIFTLKKTRSAEIELQDSKERLKAILFAIPDPLVIYSNQGETEYLNPAFVKVFGWSLDELRGKRIPFVPDDQKQITSEKLKELLGSGNNVQFETKRLTKNGSSLDVIISTSCIKNPNAEISKLVVILKDSTYQKQAKKELELLNFKLKHEATHDPLTGALNRRAILDNLTKELIRAKRRNTKISIGLCDIDHFKLVNDKHGHQVGDDVLCSFVKVMQNTLRPYDILGRYGGEEFLFVLPDAVVSAEKMIYERLRAKIAGHKMITRSGDVSITISIGITSNRGDETADAMIARADVALYRAKKNGRNQLGFAD